MYRSRKLRGQLSFEFILILALFLGVTASIANDFFNSSLDTTILAAVRQTADRLVNENALSMPSCSGAYIDHIEFNKTTLLTTVFVNKSAANCVVDVNMASKIAYSVEKNECGNKAAVLDSVIACGSKSYRVMVGP